MLCAGTVPCTLLLEPELRAAWSQLFSKPGRGCRHHTVISIFDISSLASCISGPLEPLQSFGQCFPFVSL